MKKYIFPAVLICVSFFANAQVIRERDTTRGGFNWEPWHTEAMQVPALLQPVNQRSFQATEKLCFDKKILLKGSTGGRVLDMYLYINTTVGYIGIINGREGSLGNGEFKTEDERFRLMVIGKKGNTYNYFNRKKKGRIEHYVSTSNSEQFQYQFDGFTPSNDVVYKKTQRNEYCGSKFKTWSYKANGADAPVMHVFGSSYPNKLVCKDFLGYSGAGYLNTDGGIYIVCALEKGSFSTEMREFDDVDMCFDPAGFTKQEERMYGQIDEGIRNQKEKLESKNYSGTCAAEKERAKQFQLQVLAKKKNNLGNMQQGNVLQNKNTQKAYAAMMDPIDQAEVSLLDIDVKRCQVQDRISKGSGDQSKSQAKLACLNTQKGQIQVAIVQMRALDTRYANEPGKAFAEKARLLASIRSGCD